MAIPLLEGLPRPKRLIADKAYDAMTLRRWPKKRRIRAVIPSLATQTFPFHLNRKAYKRRHRIEIVFTQMTKAPALTVGTERDDIADLHLVFGDHDAVNQQFQELAALGEVGLGQPTLHPLAELGR